MDDHLYDKIEFPLFLTRYLDFSYTDCYDIPFVEIIPEKKLKEGKFGTPEWFSEIRNFIVNKDDINPKHLNLWYLYKDKWVNVSKMTTEHSLNQDFIKSFNEEIKRVRIYQKD